MPTPGAATAVPPVVAVATPVMVVTPVRAGTGAISIARSGRRAIGLSHGGRRSDPDGGRRKQRGDDDFHTSLHSSAGEPVRLKTAPSHRDGAGAHRTHM